MSVNENTLLSSLQQFEDLISRNDDILDSSVRNELAIEGFSKSSDAEAHLKSLKQVGRTLKIGIIGRVKAGKSSLINALLFDGKEILPKAATPMTAALTSIGYAEEFSAEVRFFGNEDIALIKQKAQEYENDIAQLMENFKTEYEQKKENSTRKRPPLNEKQLRVKAQREIGDQSGLSAAFDLHQRIQSSGIDVSTLGESRILTAESVEALKAQLMDYVGSSGKYMPFTRELSLGMPLDSLKGIEVVDTPGVNDPVKSREQRTYERLKECNAAFLVSPAGQFLSQQDFELADRLSAREGTQEIYLVASQADTQLHSSIRKDAQGILPVAIDKLKQTLIGQASSALAKCENEVLRNVASQLSSRLIVTAGICETLLIGNGESTDSTASHAMKLLKDNYRDYFTRPEDLISNLKLLSGRSELQIAVDKVNAIKEDILKQQSQLFIDAQWKTLQTVKSNVQGALSSLRAQVESTDKAQLEQELADLRQTSVKGRSAANNAFINQAEEIRFRLPAQLERVITKASEILDEKTESAEGSVRETYQVDTDGVGSWFARKLWGGGYEERSRNVATLKPLRVRRTLEGLGRLMRTGLNECATESLRSWRVELTKGVSRELREAMGDASVDLARLQSVCRNTVNNMVNFPKVDIPDLPGDLAKSTTIKGRDVEDYLESAQAYASELEKSGYSFIEEVKININAIMKRDIGGELLKDMEEEVNQMQEMVEHKTLTLQKITRMEKELGGI